MRVALGGGPKCEGFVKLVERHTTGTLDFRQIRCQHRCTAIEGKVVCLRVYHNRTPRGTRTGKQGLQQGYCTDPFLVIGAHYPIDLCHEGFAPLQYLSNQRRRQWRVALSIKAQDMLLVGNKAGFFRRGARRVLHQPCIGNAALL